MAENTGTIIRRYRGAPAEPYPGYHEQLSRTRAELQQRHARIHAAIRVALALEGVDRAPDDPQPRAELLRARAAWNALR